MKTVALGVLAKQYGASKSAMVSVLNTLEIEPVAETPFGRGTMKFYAIEDVDDKVQIFRALKDDRDGNKKRQLEAFKAQHARNTGPMLPRVVSLERQVAAMQEKLKDLLA